jgi:hypothetical protein
MAMNIAIRFFYGWPKASVGFASEHCAGEGIEKGPRALRVSDCGE